MYLSHACNNRWCYDSEKKRFECWMKCIIMILKYIACCLKFHSDILPQIPLLMRYHGFKWCLFPISRITQDLGSWLLVMPGAWITKIIFIKIHVIQQKFFNMASDWLVAVLLGNQKPGLKINMNSNSLTPSDAIWRDRSGSTLAQVMAYCLTTPSHYLNKCWSLRCCGIHLIAIS